MEDEKNEVDIVKEIVKKEDEKFDVMKLLNDPTTASLLSGCKDMFKKEKQDPNICEITIKAPSDVVLKLFRVS